ncbi:MULTISPECIES: GNAT family N-acetyltransferase [unclassified Knoellia]|uniref:GNAT family N-acetyltransferase n=1 Tax=Knoellia altitudinis TaxID=3404795 RepID=UPI003610E8CF
MALRVEEVSVEDAERAGWDALLTTEDGFQQTSYLGMQQRLLGDRLHLTCAFDGPDLAAGLVTVDTDADSPWTMARPDLLLDLDASASLPALTCGGRHLGNTRALLRSPHDATALRSLLEEASARAAGADDRCVYFPHVRDDDPLSAQLAAAGFTGTRVDPYCVLPVEGGFDDYLSRLSQSRRRGIRRDRKEVREAGFVLELVPLDQCDLDRLAELDVALLRKHGNDAKTAQSRSVLEGLLDGPQVVVTTASRDGVVAGFGVMIEHTREGATQWFGNRAGFDYEMQGDIPLYFEVLFYSPLEWAHERGVEAIHVGMGSTDAKVSRGAVAHPQSCWTRWVAA